MLRSVLLVCLLHSIIRNPQTRMLENFLFSITILYKRGRAHSNTERRPKRSKKGVLLCCTADNIYIYNPTVIFPSAQN